MFRRKKKTRMEQARDDLQKQIKVVNKQAKRTRKDVIRRLNHTADELRSGIDEMWGREEQKQADKIAQDLEKFASNVEQRAEKGISDATTTAQNNLWQTLLVTLAVGVVVGIIIKNIFD
ncbi:MAG: hypothetical protein AAF846_17575 [Chloroflexota bacterium]